MKLTTEQKLERCIEFIKKLEKIEVPIIEIDDLEIDASCNECGSDDVYVKFRGHNEVIDPKFVDDIRDQAWHILADITT